MALENRLFKNCFNGGGPDIYKTFEIETTGGWSINLSYVIYDGDGSCYVYVGTPSIAPALATFLTPDGTNVAGACNTSSGCPSVNADVFPNNVYYTFQSCCDDEIISFRRGDIELDSDWVNLNVVYLDYSGSGGDVNGCYRILTGYTGTTIYIDNSATFSYTPYYSTNCADCTTYYPCITPTPTPTQTETPTPTPTVPETPTPTPTINPATPTATPSNTPTVSLSSQFGNGLTFSYFLTVTGACETGYGAALITGVGGVPPYTFNWYSPYLGIGNYKENLLPGEYLIRANDSTLPVNNEFYMSVPISDCLCANISNVFSTTCGLSNGSVTATTNTVWSSANFYLYTTDNIFISSQVVNNNQAIFSNLSAGTYYIQAVDLGGSTGTTANFIIEESVDFDFGLYIVPDAACGNTPIGKLYVTGETGTAPYSYLWSTSATTSSITGLTPGVYSVQVTDFYGCSKTQQANVQRIDPVGFGSFSAVTPTCFSPNGSLTLTITGGTAPYLYSATTGYADISYSKTLTLTGLSSGEYGFSVTDAGLCNFVVSTSLSSDGGIALVSIDTQNSFCGAFDGIITASTVGGIAPYTYTLVDEYGNTQSSTNNQTQYVWNNLGSGDYTVFVTDTTGCQYSQEVSILTTDKFTINILSTGSTCGNQSGSVSISISEGGNQPYDYSIDGISQYIDTVLTAITLNNILPGQHTVSVTDASGCTITKPFVITTTNPVNFSLYSTSCGTGSEGTVTAFISSGQPPFQFDWSDNVAGNPQQISVSGLTGGTYSLIVTDSNGCSLARQTTIDCDATYVSVQCYTMGADTFNIISPTKRGINQILMEGFNDLTSGNTDCQLISAVYTAKVQVQPQNTILTETFYSGTSLVDVPSDNLWYNTLEDLLESIPGVSDVTIDPLNNQITIKAVQGGPLTNQEIIVELIIVYDIICLQ